MKPRYFTDCKLIGERVLVLDILMFLLPSGGGVVGTGQGSNTQAKKITFFFKNEKVHTAELRFLFA